MKVNACVERMIYTAYETYELRSLVCKCTELKVQVYFPLLITIVASTGKKVNACIILTFEYKAY